MIDINHDQLSVRKQCQVLGVGRSNIYYTPMIAPDESILANEIHELWMEMPCYGYRRITAELQRRDYDINHKRVLRIMRDMNIQAIYPKPKTSQANKDHIKYPYLLRGITVQEPDQAWATDITYIKLPHGFAYLVGIIDIYSRFILGWTLSNTMETGFCLEALEKALKGGRKPGIVNTDQGVQFTSHAWIERILSIDSKVSMDGIGRWADNIFIERFWRTLKHEHLLLHDYQTVTQVRISIAYFIEIYNHKRLHQSLGYKTPAEVYF